MRPWSEAVHVVDSASATTRELFGRAAQGDVLLARDYKVASRLHSGFLTRLCPRVYDDFNMYRVSQAKRRAILGRLVIEMGPDHAPLSANALGHLQDACREAFGAATQRYLLPFKDALAAVGARELRRVGVEVPGVGVVRPHYGVFAPTKPAYCELLASFAKTRRFAAALDVGTGTGVLALLLAKSGCVGRVDATDVAPAAVACARENVALHNSTDVVLVHEADLFPSGGAPYNLIVFNPPWLPAKAKDAALGRGCPPRPRTRRWWTRPCSIRMALR